eukprot:8803327-Alexandrium_andersonii.AAC.1
MASTVARRSLTASSLSDLMMTSPVIPKTRMPRSAISVATASSAPFCGHRPTPHRPSLAARGTRLWATRT